MEEIWKPIPNYFGYEASNLGRIRSWRNGRKGNVLKPYMGHEYRAVKLRNNGRNIAFRVHQLVATTFMPNPENKPQVNHIDGDKLNNHVTNLEWCTLSENA